MTQRYFVDEPIQGEAACLSGQEAHHARNVMRKRVGDEIVLFDGSGAEFVATVTAIDRSSVDLEIIERKEISRELPGCFTLGIALPKGDRQRWIVEKAVELGVHRLVPLVTERGVAQPEAKAIERLRRVVIEAAKQCGRNLLMEITEAVSLPDFFRSESGNALQLIAHPDGVPLQQVATFPSAIRCAVGPEGGFSDSEIGCSDRENWSRVSLGLRILRVETAAMMLTACCALRMQAPPPDDLTR